ncbi:hypothetical protein [Streptomyces sp. CL12]|uniref:hypothetical protein n=1 Tax=Streptomyces sp. CL12 TaxID=3391744 RepID=UPI003A8106B3
MTSRSARASSSAHWARVAAEARTYVRENGSSGSTVCRITAVRDELWPRPVDTLAALRARAYGDGDPVVLGVHNPLLPANSGPYLVGPTEVRRDRPRPQGPPHRRPAVPHGRRTLVRHGRVTS